jgi:hypothetical protein
MNHSVVLAPLARLLATGLLALGLAATAAAAESGERARLAEAYFRVGGFEELYNNPDRLYAMVTTQVQAMEAGMAQGMTPPQRAEFRRAMEAVAPEVRRLTAEVMPRLRPDMVAAMAATYSEEELKALVAFYESPVGRAVAAKNERLLQAMAQVSGRHLGAMLQELEQVVAARARAAAQPPAKGK